MARRRASGRGSSRAAKRARTAEEGETIVVARGRDKEEEKAQNTQGNDPDTGTTARRTNPRRIAGDRAATAARIAAAADAAPPPEVIHERAFARITAAERETWQGWTDIESEPAFFNFILGELGIRGATIQEVFAVDEASAACLPNPAGLIFLYRFVEEEAGEAREDCPEELWFANQTTSNACATLAMLNIAMNCPGLHLGAALDRFKAATQHLPPALRGHLLSSDRFIRARHNAFARRLDMLTSDMALQQEWSDAAAPTRAAGRGKKRAAAQADEDEAAFHFIAYVPMGGDVWELNGMQEKGLRLGSFSDDWTSMARDRIATRMLAYQQYDDRAVFSLLALCQTDTHDADSDSDVARAAARRADYTPAVHCWVKKLADKGVLRRLATGAE